MIENVKKQVYDLLESDDSGHGIDHINRVLSLSLKFAKEENVNEEIVSLIALLHDVDDYKLFGTENAENLSNARMILKNNKVNENVQEQVLSEIKNIGYKKTFSGYRPKTIEGMIVSDADMCDAVGVNGILRTYKYTTKHNRPFFDRNTFPLENMDASKYNRVCSDSSVNHLFEKGLKLHKLMLTEAGKKEIEKRHKITIDILYQLFDEEDAKDWIEYLDKYLVNN